MRQLTPYQRRLLRLISSGLCATVSLFFSILTASYNFAGQRLYTAIFIPIASITLGTFYLLQFIFDHRYGKLGLIHAVGLFSIFLVMAVIGVLSYFDYRYFGVFAILLGVSIIFSAVIYVLRRPKPRTIIMSILRAIFGGVIILVFSRSFGKEEDMTIFFSLVALVMAAIAFFLAMVLVFSGVRRATIIGILRKTYSIEILFGLVVLIFATAMVLSVIEDSMTSFGDALWYCFAIVTTIGFGDFTATTIVGRVLSVVLGIYGIVVVALITSIIVNFYNENRSERGDKELKQELAKLEEDRTPKEEQKGE